MVQAGQLRTEHIYGEIGEIVAGLKAGRESQGERILFWHKGFAVSDIALEAGGNHLLIRWRPPAADASVRLCWHDIMRRPETGLTFR